MLKDIVEKRVEVTNNTLPKISFKVFRKVGRVFKAFVNMYLPFYGETSDIFFDKFELFGYLSAVLYEADEENEYCFGSGSSTLDRIDEFLVGIGEMDSTASSLLDDGREYFRFEKSFLSGIAFTELELLANMSRRSTDFRLMHYLLCKTLNRPLLSNVLELYGSFEMIFEIEDDMASYSEDLNAGTFNFYEGMKRLHCEKAPTATFRILQYYEEKLWKLVDALDYHDKQAFHNIFKWYRLEVPLPGRHPSAPLGW